MKHKFVEFIPTEIEEGVLYISLEYDIAKHKCACGCGSDIVTSLSPARWKLIYDGETVSLQPSIGNWTHECQSHYFITNSQIKWAGSMNQKRIDQVIESDKKAMELHIESSKKTKGILARIKKIFKLK